MLIGCWCGRRLKKLHEEFYEHVDAAEVAEMLEIDTETVDCLYNYWVLKRKVSVWYISHMLLFYSNWANW